jgi:hypothetical protein
VRSVAVSVLSTIKADVEKFFSDLSTDAGKFAAAFVKIFKKAPSALQMVENFVNEVAPVITAAVGLADPLAEPAVAAVLATIETGLAGLQAAATAATSGTSLLTDLENFATDVPQLLTSIKVTNPALQAAVERIVDLVVGEAKVLIPAVESWVSQISGSATKSTTAAA